MKNSHLINQQTRTTHSYLMCSQQFRMGIRFILYHSEMEFLYFFNCMVVKQNRLPKEQYTSLHPINRNPNDLMI